MVKRIFLFALTNILIIATISVVLRIFGLDQYLDYYGQSTGIDYQALMVFCLVWGMAGSLISLLLSKVMAKWMMGVKIISPNQASGPELQLVQTVHRLAQSAGLNKMPEVGIYASPEINAFATGPTKNNSLVAVSSGLLQRMDKGQVEGVLSHEVAHIANGDMVTMTLIQGVVNAFVMFFARALAFIVGNFLRRDDEDASPWLNFALVMVFQILFGFLGMMVVGYFSRWREFRADAGGARLGGSQKMIAALQALKGTTTLVDTEHQGLASLKISGKEIFALFSTHPPLDERIRRLQQHIG